MEQAGKFLGKILLTALAVLISASVIEGVHIKSYGTAVMVALVLALLNSFVKPILVLLTLPATLFSFGLFLLVINMLIIKWAGLLVRGFEVQTWWSAFWFSVLLSLVSTILQSLVKPAKPRE